MTPKFWEFFSGGGMARAGLEPRWKCTFANDFDELKAETYKRNWGSKEFADGDISFLTAADLPAKADLAWASFPCQDFSVAGFGAGLRGDRSAAFWSYCDLLRRLRARGRAPSILVLENVIGALTSRSGEDFRSICGALAELNYQFGALVLDAAHFVPQSRPRLFIVATRRRKSAISDLISQTPVDWTSPDVLIKSFERLPRGLKAHWVWWKLPEPARRKKVLTDIIKGNRSRETWHPHTETNRLLKLMSSAHRRRIRQKQEEAPAVGTLYRRMRATERGAMKQRAEVRFDDVAGCLRTPAGGSSRQIIVKVTEKKVRTRLLAVREGAALMGLRADYKLPKNYYDAFRVLGDGLAVPLVRFLSSKLLLPLVDTGSRR